MVDQHMVAASQLASYMQQLGAQWVGRNEQGSNVYRTGNGVTYVVATRGDRHYVIVRRIGGSCRC